MIRQPDLSVCVSTYGRSVLLDRLLGALYAQAAGLALEVVVYDDASSDGTPDVLTRWSDRLDLVALRGEVNRGPAYGRNQAWRAARAPLVVFTDDDCEPQPGWLEAHLAGAGTWRITIGSTRPAPDQAHLRGPFSRSLLVTDTTFFQTCNIGYPRELLLELGGFHEGFRKAAGEDTELGCRAVVHGAEAVFVAEALVHHDIRPSSWSTAVRDSSKWVDVPLFGKLHPDSAGTVLHSTRWWKASHPPAALAAAGLVGAVAVDPLLLVVVLPWLRFRTSRWRVDARIRQWPWVLPAQLVVDLAEVVALARGSVKHRHLLL